MTKLLNTAGDRLLAALLRKTEAGACVPEMGENCACVTSSTDYSCIGHKKYFAVYQWKRNCTGYCVNQTYMECPGSRTQSSGQGC